MKNRTLPIFFLCLTFVWMNAFTGALAMTENKVDIEESSPSSVLSPDEKIKVNLIQEGGVLYYEVYKNNELIIQPSKLGLTLLSVDFTRNLTLTSSSIENIQETYSLPSGKKSNYANHCNELTSSFTKLGNRIDVIFRVYDEGFAYRYYVEGDDHVSLRSEESEVNIKDIECLWGQEYNKDYSWFYDKRDWEQARAQKELCAPVLTKSPSGYFLLTEAANYGDYSVSKILVNETTGSYKYEPVLPVTVSLPLTTPWRAVMLGELPEIVASVMVENLNPPTTLEDLSWIKPGRSSWDWGGEDTRGNRGLEVIKSYIDLAADMGWEYFLLDDGWKNNSEFRLEDVIAYANTKSVGVFVWESQRDNSLRTYDDIYQTLSSWKDIGVKGVKIDFFEEDSQEMMKRYDSMLEIAGELELLVNLHGCTKPSGTRRKWPHLLTTEAVLGGEFYIQEHPWLVHAAHNINLTMTRNVIGPMDYTPCDFAKRNGKIQNVTSWSHQLALAVAYESGFQCYIDCPRNYKYHIAETILKEIPAEWDDIVCLEAKPDSFITIARRSGEDWYVASLCNKKRTLELSLDFLDNSGTYYAHIYKDGECKSEILFDYKKVAKGMSLSIPMLENGGTTILFTKRSDKVAPEVIKYEAENSRTYGVKVKDENCSGGVYMSNIGKGNTLKFQQVEVGEDGEYALTLFYMTDEERTAYIKINEEEPLYYTFESSGGVAGTDLAYITIVVTLRKGINNIEIGNREAFTPNFDRITIKSIEDLLPLSLTKERIGEDRIQISIHEGQIKVYSEHPALFTLFDLNGKTVIKQKIESGETLLPINKEGLYIANINDGIESYSRKFFLKKII